jgi:predicted DCC family thiol-disulfide oxidoreductase YuxK
MKLLDRWMFTEYERCLSGLEVYRRFYAIAMLTMTMPRGLWILSIPSSFFAPPMSLAVLVDHIPSPLVLYGANVVLVVALVALFLGVHTVPASFAVTMLLIFLNTWEYSFGKIVHDILPVLAPAVLACAWGPPRDQRQKRPAWPLALFALLIGIAMFTAALPKMGWLDPGTQAVRGWLIDSELQGYGRPLGNYLIRQPYWPAAWEALDWLTVLCEAALLPAMLSVRTFRVALAGMTLTHVGIVYAMGIFFVGNLIAYAAFVDWSGLAYLDRWLRTRTASLALTLAISAAVAGVLLGFGNPFAAHDGPLFLPTGYVMIAPLSAIIAIVFLATLGRPRATPQNAVLLFDGVCNLCNGWVRFVIARDTRAVFRFAPLQSPAGVRLAGHSAAQALESMVLLHKGKTYVGSAAVLRTLALLGPPWGLLKYLLAVPRPVRDAVYRFVAARRYRWFGRLEACRLPTPAERGRFLETADR